MQTDRNFLSRDFPRENEAIVNGGVTFTVKYVGCIEVFASMKVLDFQTRSAVAKECIHQVRDGLVGKTPKKRHVEKKVQQCISKTPCMEHAGSSVLLNISSRCLELKSLDTKEVIARHDMPRISFASGGDADAFDFIAYVAKDITEWRACYVIECGNEKAKSIISTMGKAFELRYKEYYGSEVEKHKIFPESFNRKLSKGNVSCDQEYYNDLPGKIPPELSNAKTTNKSPGPRERISSNLIDLETPIEHNYVNHLQDEMDDMVFSDSAMSGKDSTSKEAKLSSEKWFHGSISRVFSESLLKNDGDFLVRESQNTKGQFVLTGMKCGQPKHLLLIDPDGFVRTKDRVFDDIPHLINYHWSSFLPIISSESALLLQTPVQRTTEFKK